MARVAASHADFTKEDFYVILANQPGATSWLITAAIYMLTRKDYNAGKNCASLSCRPSAVLFSGRHWSKFDKWPGDASASTTTPYGPAHR
jgi:hypothetical protein